MAKTAEMYDVLKVFRDKETKKRYIVGASFPGEDPERIAELQEGAIWRLNRRHRKPRSPLRRRVKRAR